MGLTPVITEHWDDPELYTLAGYQRHGGYRALASALQQDPDALIGMPTFIYHLFNAVADEGFHWPNLHRVVLGGEKAPLGLREKLRALAERFGSTDLRILSTYGFTEAKAAWPDPPPAPPAAAAPGAACCAARRGTRSSRSCRATLGTRRVRLG